MDSIKRLRVENLRGFGPDMPFIPINKLNILVGKNSSGKSTFARLFPLLRQSLEGNTKGPVLWFGDYVDFGDFNSAFNDGVDIPKREIVFDFDAQVTVRKGDPLELMEVWYGGVDRANSAQFSVRVGLSVAEDAQRTVPSKIRLEVDGMVFVIEMSSSGVRFEGWPADAEKPIVFSGPFKSYNSVFLPLIYENVESSKRWFMAQFGSSLPSVKKQLVDYLERFHHKSKKRKSINDALKQLKLSSRSDVEGQIKKLFKTDRQFFKNISGQEKSVFDQVYLFVVGMNLNRFLSALNDAIRDCFSGVRYLGPVRATAERFYRYQDLQVQEIDHTGGNLPMLLNSMPKLAKEQLQKWMMTHFSFCFEEENKGAHYALLIREEGSDASHNISDMGFGYSQVLPIIISVWLECFNVSNNNSSRSSKSRIIVIEQPELHLHPIMQYRFATAIANIAKENFSDHIRFVFETHSNYIIDGLGDAINNDQLLKDDVSIVLFSKKPHESSVVKFSEYDNDGYLNSWPPGFLSA